MRNIEMAAPYLLVFAYFCFLWYLTSEDQRNAFVVFSLLTALVIWGVIKLWKRFLQ